MRLLQVVKIDFRTCWAVASALSGPSPSRAELHILTYKQHPPMARRRDKPDTVQRHTHMSDLFSVSPNKCPVHMGKSDAALVPPSRRPTCPYPPFRAFSILHNVPVGSRVELPSCLSPKGGGEKKRGGMVRLHRVQMKAANLLMYVAIRSSGGRHSRVSHVVWPGMWSFTFRTSTGGELQAPLRS